MSTHDSQVSLADLASAGVPITHIEAVTVVRDVVMRAAQGSLPGIPSAQVVRLHASGEVSVEGPIATDTRAVLRAGHLLQALLPGFEAPQELRVPGALRLVVTRALGTVDLPPYASLGDFAEALGRFSVPDLAATVRDLVARHASVADSLRAADHLKRTPPSASYLGWKLNPGRRSPLRIRPRHRSSRSGRSRTS